MSAIDFGLILALGFFGSFGHCAGMCGPLVVAFSLPGVQGQARSWQEALVFHGLLNLGRLLSYGLAGTALGGLGSIVAASGQLAGIDSALRQGLSLFTGLLLVWFGLAQIRPQWLPRLPMFHPLAAGQARSWLEKTMVRLGAGQNWWQPLVLGSMWGFIPCGFLYAAQLKAVETGSAWIGGLTLVAFGLGTVPVLLATGWLATRASADRRSQLFRLGGWLTLAIGLLTLNRSSQMHDWMGHGALVGLVLALMARPLSHWWSGPLQYRRAIGITAYILALAHTGHTMEHTFHWQVATWDFLAPMPRLGLWGGLAALGLLTPAALTSYDRAVTGLGRHWRSLHLLTVPALGLVGVHAICLGSSYLGNLPWSGLAIGRASLLAIAIMLVWLARWLRQQKSDFKAPSF